MLRLGIDIGGTFTDFVLLDDTRGVLRVGKLLTTPEAPEVAVLDGMRALLSAEGMQPQQIDTVIHGTTLVTNSVIERKGASTALVMTRGFRDVLIFRDERRFDHYDFRIDLPEPLVPRSMIFEADERLLADGTEYRPMDEDGLREVAREMKTRGVESVGVVFLYSFVDPAHERRAGEILAEELPGVDISLSSDVLPAIREYLRTSTTAVNAYVKPKARRYLRRLEDGLRQGGFQGRFYLMLSSGGTGTPETAERYPVRLLESGPAAGAEASVHYGRMCDMPDLLSFDMGGTTAKLCLIERNQPSKAAIMETARLDRYKPGSGLPVQIPVIEMIEIGAGGGSIAAINELGLLKVGPESAGADPGPACYARGGELPTVTDADLVLGYLNSDYFLGGEMRLDRERAERAIQDHLAGPGGMSVVEAAHGIHRVVNEQMALAAKIHVLEKGQDPRKYSLSAFGGAGPVHAYGVAAILGTQRMLLPIGAGAASALGMLVAPISFDFVRSHKVRLRDCQPERVEELYREMEAEGITILAQAGVPQEDVRLERAVEMRYLGQGYEIEVALPRPGPIPTAELRRLFEAEYLRLFSRYSPDFPAELVTLRLVALGPPPGVATAVFEPGTRSIEEATKGVRQVYFKANGGFTPSKVLDRYRLPIAVPFEGPAVVEERESTAVVPPGAVAVADRFGNLIVDLKGGRA